MSKSKYIGEFELKASADMLYPYISTASGLAEWFADDVILDPRRYYIFKWDGEKVLAKQITPKEDCVRYEFLSDKAKEVQDPNYIEFILEENDLTQTTFMQIIDYSENPDHDDLDELYGNFVLALKEIVGG